MVGPVRMRAGLRRLALALLLLPWASAFALTPDEAAVWQTYLAVEKCKALKPDLGTRLALPYAAWTHRNADVLARLTADPVLQREREHALLDTVRELQHGGMGFALAHCRADILVQVLAPPPDPDPRFASAEQTWAVLKGALGAGDAEAALDCMTDGLLRQLDGVLQNLSPETLKRLGDYFHALRLDGAGTAGRRQGVVLNPEGGSGEIVFVKVRGEWKIASL